MGKRDTELTATDDAALAWAQAAWPHVHIELVSRAPWATTYRLRQSGAGAYLKLVHGQSPATVALPGKLAAHLPGSVPTVLAQDLPRGWLLSADHGGTTLDYDAEPAELVDVLQLYARLQARARHEPSLLLGLPVVELQALPQGLLNFLSPAPAGFEAAGRASAAYFIGDEYAAGYHRLFKRRLALMTAHLDAAKRLPPTLNHGDLRPPNVGRDASGAPLLMDWDDVAVGPAGLSLHGLFGGCSLPHVLLSGSAAAKAAADTPNGRLAAAYLDTLVEACYATRKTLQRALPAAAFAGTIQFVLNFAAYGTPDRQEDIGVTLLERLGSLLDVCDLLTAPDRALALDLADDYLADGQLERARGLLEDLVARDDQDLAAVSRLAKLALAQEQFDFAAEVARHGLGLSPDDAALHACLGLAESARLSFGRAEASLKRAMSLAPDQPAYRQDLARVQSLARQRRMAAKVGVMPTLSLSPEQAEARELKPDQAALGAALFKRYGVVQVDNAFPAAMIEKLQKAFFDRYTPYFREDKHPDALYLGDKRYMLTVDLDDPFNDPDLIGMPTLMPIISEVLGHDFVLGGYTAVISLPGAKDQGRHKDHPALFAGSRWHHSLPSFTVQVSIPLVPLNALTGPTRYHKGTHRIDSEEAQNTPFQDPDIALGGCLLHDYRCMHLGVGNRSDVVRPMLSLIFTRPWFKDYKNYDKQPPLRLSRAAYEQLPEDLQPLFSWWMTERHVKSLERSVLLAG